MDNNTLIQNRLCAEALSAEQSSRLRQAASIYRQAISCDPSNPTPYLFFGYVLMLLGDQEAATQVWSLGADMDMQFINARVKPMLSTVVEEFGNQVLFCRRQLAGK